jgi:hypothetical protein
VAYDWGESFTALNLCVKPALDGLFMTELATLARAGGDYHFAELARSLEQDCAWQRQWTAALIELVRRAEADNTFVVRGWIERWLPEVDAAIDRLTVGLGLDAALAARVHAGHHAWLTSLGVGA